MFISTPLLPEGEGGKDNSVILIVIDYAALSCVVSGNGHFTRHSTLTNSASTAVFLHSQQSRYLEYSLQYHTVRPRSLITITTHF
jgi:hypothetical protein